MPSAMNSDHVPFSVPTVDISPFLADPSSKDASVVLDEIRKACLSTGFFLIAGHGISKELQQAAFDAAKKFFDLDYNEKKKLDCRKMIGHRGYDVLASQAYEDGIMPDLKEVRIYLKKKRKKALSLISFLSSKER
jgi:isopenicillin N synthase-like dioxygenase